MSIEALARALAPLKSLVLITGAGVSAESGIATFRGSGGHWERYRAEDLASAAGFARDPELVWRWYDARRRQIAQATPNPGHQAMAALESLFNPFLLITQNVDGLHQAAGSRQVIEIHGSIWRVRCQRSGAEWQNQQLYEHFPVSCRCGALLRPAVLWFGESYDSHLIQRAQGAVAGADAVLVAGTSGQVWIVAGLLAQARSQALRAEFNLEATDTSATADHLILGPTGHTLPKLLERIQACRQETT